MPPKTTDLKTLIAKRDNAIKAIQELFEEFDEIYSIEPQLERLESTFKLIEGKYRNIKKQQEIIADKIVEDSELDDNDLLSTNQKVGESLKCSYLKVAKTYAAYQKKISQPTPFNANNNPMEEMTSAVTKMAEAMKGAKSGSSGLERLPVPAWDGSRRSYLTWKKEFNHWMKKYSQDEEEQLQRFRKAMPKGFWWTNQVKTCKSICHAWEVLDIEFADKRKMLDELLTRISNQRSIRSDSKSLTRYAAQITGYVNDMENNGCPVTTSNEAPFFMSQLLSKLDPKDNAEFGREMKRRKMEETIPNLIQWLHEEASLRSRGRSDHEASSEQLHSNNRVNHSVEVDTTKDSSCPLGCQVRHLLAGCPHYQASTVDQRWEIVKRHQRCRKCLRPHHTKDCNKLDGTTCDRCKKNHHRSLHNERKYTDTSNLNPDVPPFQRSNNGTINNNADLNITGQRGDVKTVTGLLPIQKVKVENSNGEPVEVLAMLDSGSNSSLLSKSAAKRLGLRGSPTHLTMSLAGGSKRSENSEVIQLTVVSPIDEEIKKPLIVHTVNQPCSSAKTISKNILERYSHLKPLSDKLHLAGGSVDLLLGTDLTDGFVDVHVISGEPGEPIAKMNCFGWYTLGQFTQSENSIQSIDVGTMCIKDNIDVLLKQDQLGVKPTKLCTCSENELRENKFVKSLSESTTLVDGRIQVKMPWKEIGPPQKSNYDIALKRMCSTEKSLKRKLCTMVVVEEVRKLVDQGFVKRIQPEEVDHSRPEWYLPLQAVFTPEKTTKVRLVFDSSCVGHDGLSLNDRLEKGPNYINHILNVLTAWRWDEVAYAGDVRKMFNQILVHPDDQVFHRFIWRDKPTDEPTVYQWLRLSFGDKPAPDIATNSINVLAKTAQSEYPRAAAELFQHAYVDDVAGSKPTVEEVKQVTTGIDSILENGKFEIKSWHSNSKDIDQSEGEKVTDLLGHKWDKETDKFTFKRDEIAELPKHLTKRNCLALVAKFWDPIGIAMPVTIKFRVDLQELWCAGYGWDDIMSEDLQQRWKENHEVMNNLLSLEYNRKLKPTNASGPPEIHGFSDAGDQAYGATLFLRWKLPDGTYHCAPVVIKAFVAPVKRKSIPRLELLGCLTLARIYGTCMKMLQFADIDQAKKFLWVDSTTVLSWIKTPPREFRPFVSARVAEIQETVETENFRYIRSRDNPADALTRGINPGELQDWLAGPTFLQYPEAEWPLWDKQPKKELDQKETLRETKPLKRQSKVKKRNKQLINTAVETRKSHDTTAEAEVEENPVLVHLLTVCSSFSKARRTLAYVNRFVQNARRNKREGALTVEELQMAEKQLFAWSQSHLNIDSFNKQVQARLAGDGLVRAHGRLEDIRSLPNDMRNPIILPRNHPLAYLLLKHLHERRCHCGHKSLMHEVRKKFWIAGLRGMAKYLTKNCVICRKLRNKPLEQIMGQLPSLRAAVGIPPFSNTAIDMFGPFHIKLNRRTLKEAQVMIFTCMTTRAVHLELVTDRSTGTFLMAFRRFASLRGHPNTCWSDCGTNFVGAQSYLQEIMEGWEIKRIQSTLSEEYTCDFKWKWNIPHASHQNGVVESLIKSVRQAMNAVCKDAAFTEEQWRTLLAEITYLINSRPLYPSSDDIWESPPITPNDILLGQHTAPPQPETEARPNPRDMLRSTEKRVEDFWKCWMKYFAPNLLPRNKWFRTRSNVEIGDLVLEVDSKNKRSRWKMAIIVATYPGNDTCVRKVRIKNADGEYDRPIHKLCLIATKEELTGEAELNSNNYELC